MFQWANASPSPTPSRSTRPFLQGLRSWPTHRQTDRPRKSSNNPHLALSAVQAMRANTYLGVWETERESDVVDRVTDGDDWQRRRQRCSAVSQPSTTARSTARCGTNWDTVLGKCDVLAPTCMLYARDETPSQGLTTAHRAHESLRPLCQPSSPPSPRKKSWHSCWLCIVVLMTTVVLT